MDKVLHHCYFWSKEKQLKFLEAASDILEDKGTEDHTIEQGAADVIGANWTDHIDTKGFIARNYTHSIIIIIIIDIPGNYDPTLVEDLLRAIKAKV